MEDLYSYENVKQNEGKDAPHSGVAPNQKIKASRLQTKKRLHPFLKESSPSSPEADRLESALYMESQKRKRCRPSQISRLALQTKDLHNKFAQKICTTSPSPEEESHAASLSQSFVNLIMVDGKKSKAERIFSQTLKKLAGYLQDDVEKKSNKKKEINLFDKGSSTPLLIISDQVEKRNVYHFLQRAINNVKPTLQVRKVRIARSIYQVPFIMKRERQEKNAVRWIIESAKKKSRHSGATFSECLASSVLEAFTAQGQAREKRDQLHRTAEANRAYLRFRWW